MGLRVPIWKINFCSRVLRLSELPKCNERPQIAICCLEWLGKLKCLATGFDASLSFLSTSRRCSLNRSPSRRPASQLPRFNFYLSRFERTRISDHDINYAILRFSLPWKSHFPPFFFLIPYSSRPVLGLLPHVLFSSASWRSTWKVVGHFCWSFFNCWFNKEI